jgi:hypothetical protein
VPAKAQDVEPKLPIAVAVILEMIIFFNHFENLTGAATKCKNRNARAFSEGGGQLCYAGGNYVVV